MNKKGQIEFNQMETSRFSIFQFIILAFVFVIFCAGMIYVHSLLNDKFTEIGLANEVNAGQPGYTNMSLASEMTFGSVYRSIQSLRLVAGMWILGFAACIIITNVMVKAHPLFFFAYVLVTILAVILAVPISNTYQELMVSGIFGGELANFTISNFILAYLPLVTIIVGILGGVFLFINMVRTGTEVSTLP